jgi:hypothetical protein
MLAAGPPIPWSAIGAILGIIAFLGTAFAVFWSASARATIEVQKERIDVLEDERADCKARIDRLAVENRVLTEKVTSAAAIKELVEVIQESSRQQADSHLELREILAAIKERRRGDG